MGVEWASSPKHPVNLRRRNRDRAVYAFGAGVALFGAGYLAGAARAQEELPPPDTKTAIIGSSPVPSDLECEEDEVIGYVQEGPTPYDLGCVHVEGLYHG